jgi:4-hydroxy-2-oxoheptanedioate aldolase
VQEFVLKNPLLEKIQAGQITSIMSVRLTRGIEIAALAKSAGFDALYVDMEHSTISAGEAGQICMACLGVGITPLIRVPTIDAAHVSRLLDAGALGIIAPHIQDAQQARLLVDLCRFTPLGSRSQIAWLPQLGYQTMGPEQTSKVMNRVTMVVAMIEDEQAATNVQEIAAVDGLDMLFVGSNDLCASLGIAGQPEHPRFDAALTNVIQNCHRHGKAVGIGGLAKQTDLLKRYVSMGAQMISLGTDISFLLDGARRQANVAIALNETH